MHLQNVRYRRPIIQRYKTPDYSICHPILLPAVARSTASLSSAEPYSTFIMYYVGEHARSSSNLSKPLRRREALQSVENKLTSYL